MTPEADSRAAAVVDLGAVERNCAHLVSELADGAELCAVVKADGYGHGALECARAALAGGASWLAVAAATEAAELRPELPDVPILTMGALTESELDLAIGAGSEVGLWTRRGLDAAAAAAERRGTVARVHVKYDTGMGRLGEFDPAAVEELAERCADLSGLELASLWTHFATADDPDSTYFGEQLERFGELATRIRGRFPDIRLHAANSAATLRDREAHFDMVRCGIAVYGLDPFHSDPLARGLEPAMELRSYVAEVKRFPPGASAGYGRRWEAPSERMVAVLPIGYGDGVRRGLTNNAEVLVGGRRHPLVGTVSMDNITVDLGEETDFGPGEAAVLIGAQGDDRILCEEVAARLETINYEVTCGISQRVPRVFVRSAVAAGR